MYKQAKTLLKILICSILCLGFGFGLFACQENTNKPTTTTQVTHSTPDWDAIRDNLDKFQSEMNDVLEQVESTHTYVITYSVDLEYNNSVGNEWQYGIRYNDQYIESSSKIIIKDNPTKIELVAFATELDDWKDCGTTTITFDALSVGEKQTGWATVIVKERDGRYSSNTAKWYFDIAIERIN